jgi:hypothetical protein
VDRRGGIVDCSVRNASKSALPCNRKISADTEQEAVAILSRPVYRGFGPTLATECLAKKHHIQVSRDGAAMDDAGQAVARTEGARRGDP